MTATNMCSNFVGFRYSPPLKTIISLEKAKTIISLEKAKAIRTKGYSQRIQEKVKYLLFGKGYYNTKIVW